MRKGNLGLNLLFYPIVAFALVIAGQTMLCGVLLGLVLIVEKDEWVARQSMQAFFLSLLFSVTDELLYRINNTISYTFNVSSMLTGGPSVSDVFSILRLILWLGIVVFAAMGISRVSKGQEANIPLVAPWSYKAFGYIQNIQTPPQAPFNGNNTPPAPPAPPAG